jgi:mannose-6-phosphate isomerase-like protein (cupin superfamily)
MLESADELMRWIERYEQAWRTPGTAMLAELFSPAAAYLVSPYAEPLVGLPAIERFWEEGRDGPDEAFSMQTDVVAFSDGTGVARVAVTYGEPVRQEYLDLWVVRFDDEGRATRFEEWPFWPTHGISPVRADPMVVAAADVEARPWREVVRSAALSAGVYALDRGAVDGQQPHAEDEVYVVVSGSAVLDVDGTRTEVAPGSVAFVPAGLAHSFVDISEDLRVAVVFAPPETPGPAT